MKGRTSAEVALSVDEAGASGSFFDAALGRLRVLAGGVFLARGLYARQNPNAYQYNRAHNNPVRGHVHQIRGVSQSADHDGESGSVNSEGHLISLPSQ
jgi:hypothetical protein